MSQITEEEFAEVFKNVTEQLKHLIKNGTLSPMEAMSASLGSSLAMNYALDLIEKYNKEFNKDKFITAMTDGEITEWPTEPGVVVHGKGKTATKKDGDIIYPAAFHSDTKH